MIKSFLVFTLKFILVLSLISFPFLGFSQKWDIGMHVGAAGYMGEINEVNPFLFNRPNFGISVRRNLNPDFSIKLGFDQAWIYGNDANSKNPDQIQRNLNFTSSITEASAEFEFNFFKFNPYNRFERFSPYLITGIAIFKYNPYTFLNGGKIYLRTVGTEGQLPTPTGTTYKSPGLYSTLSWNIPIGAGFKYHLSGPFSLTIEYGYRFTHTDYLDDIGGRYPDLKGQTLTSNVYLLSDRSKGHVFKAGDERGDSRSYDKYFFGNVGIIYTFRSIDCPKFNH